jgi:hypothetical protein
MQHNGRPQLVATGIAPLGIIAIGIVPMGVVAIGVVPMGVISLGAVGMGLISAAAVNMGVLTAGVTTMGVAWSGIVGMGPYQLGATPTASNPRSSAGAPQALVFASRDEAETRALALGCSGAHQHGDAAEQWMPCNTMAEFMQIQSAQTLGHNHH